MTTTATPLALRWNQVACEAIYHARTTATVAARALAMVHTAMYDAWALYTKAECVSTTTFARLKRRDPQEQTQQNREMAFSYAAWRVLTELFASYLPAEQKCLFDDLLAEQGLTYADETPGLDTPQGIGLLSADLVLASRRGDGADEANRYADYTGYEPVNEPPFEAGGDCVEGDPAEAPRLIIDRWQPQVTEGHAQKFLTPHWGLVRPFALEWGGACRPCAPIAACERHASHAGPPYRSAFVHQAREAMEITGRLTDDQKLSAEYWAGLHEDKAEGGFCVKGHGRTTLPVQCCRLARYFARKNQFTNGNVIKFFFALGNALLDASIAVWDAKQYYDYCRPISAIHELQRLEVICGADWEPYLKSTPPHAEYPAARSALFWATAEVARKFWDDTSYGECVQFPSGSSAVHPGKLPECDLELSWRTLEDAAADASHAQLWSGAHFEEGVRRGREIGVHVAACVWEKVCRYLKGLPK